MRLSKRSRREARPQPHQRRARRGIALFIAMFMVVGIGALALSAIYLTANATLISKTYEREDDLKYESEAALAMGKAELNFNPAALPNTAYVALFRDSTITAADGQPVPGLTVTLYAGQTGSTSGQFGRFASLVSEARDRNGTGFVRRLELAQESFAKFAYWSNSEPVGIFFCCNDKLWGPVWSNDDLSIASTAATFEDEVGTAGKINGVGYGTFVKGYSEHQHPIHLPSLATLATLKPLATVGGMSFTAPTIGDETSVRMRIEFVAIDLDNNKDSTEADEGFFRVYTANGGQEKWLRGDWPVSIPSTIGASDITNLKNCGDFHYVVGDTGQKFFPFSVHVHTAGVNTWFDSITAPDRARHGAATLAAQLAAAVKEGDSLAGSGAARSAVLQHPLSRCYLGGDPHLVAVARTTASGPGHYSAADVNKGGDDTTFTAVDQYGSWTAYGGTPVSKLTAVRSADAQYLFPLYRGYNTGTKGVMYVEGTVGVSGVLRGDITLYTPNTVVILDDVRYANDPGGGLCIDILGIISGQNTVVADNAINTPQRTIAGTFKSYDDSPDLYIHAVIMAVGTSFSVQHHNIAPTTGLTCGGAPVGRGCLYLTGGVIQDTRGPVGLATGSGFIKRYSYDRCAVANPPPYFPTTGRFTDNRYYELDPVRFNVGNLFKSLTPTP